jgi:Secretion system C-terminal sorting domain
LTGGEGITVAPNPAVSQTTIISNNSSKQIKSIYVYNALGSEVAYIKNANFTLKYNLDVSRFKEGFYIIKTYLSDNSSVVATLIKSS